MSEPETKKQRRSRLTAADLDVDDVIRAVLLAWGLQPGDQIVVHRRSAAPAQHTIDLTKWLPPDKG